MKDKLNLCVVGIGQIFEQYHLPAIIETRAYNIVGFVDRDEKRLKSLSDKYGVKGFSSIDDVPDADICFVATPANVRTSVIKPALKKGMHVVCEKPFTYTREEAEDLIASAEENNRNIYVTQTRRYFTNLILLREWLSSSFVDVREIRIVEGGLYGWTSVGTERATAYKNDAGVLHDTGSHIIDTVFFLFGEKIEEIRKDQIKLSLFDYENGANNFKAKLDLKIRGNKTIPLTIIISRDQNLLDFIQVQTQTGEINTRSLFSPTIDISTLGGGEHTVHAKKEERYPLVMDEVFNSVWTHITSEISESNPPFNFSFNAKTVLSAINLIDLFIEKRFIRIFDDFYGGSWS